MIHAAKTKKARDFTTGPIFVPMLLFALPVVLTGILQMLYNTADKIVVGQFSGEPNALGAIGCTASLYALITALCNGLSMGTGVTVARRFGARDDRGLSRAVHTGFVVGGVIGTLIGVIGFFACRPLLILMGTKPELLELSVLYMKIIFVGTPLSILYNFGAAAMRSVGDSRTPLIILALSGLLNVGFNLFFVLTFGMSVEGVALGTIIAQGASVVAIWWRLSKRRDSSRFGIRKLCVDKGALSDIIRIGLPSGLQGSLFAISNVILSSAVNTFDTATVTGNAVAMSIGTYTTQVSTGVYQAVLTFTGQNAGAKLYDRVKRILRLGLLQGALLCFFIGLMSNLLAEPLVGFFVEGGHPEYDAILLAAKERLLMVTLPYFTCSVMDILTGHLRGLRSSIIPMVTTIFFACIFRIFWVYAVFPHLEHTLIALYSCYIVSWVTNSLVLFIASHFVLKKEKKAAASEALQKIAA